MLRLLAVNLLCALLLASAATAVPEYAVEHERLVSYWSGLLQHAKPLLRKSALRQLTQLKAEETLPQIAPLLRDPETEVRIAACRAVGGLADNKAIPLLRELAQKDQDASVRRAAGRAADQIIEREQLRANSSESGSTR